MKISLTPAAQQFLETEGKQAVTITSLVFTSCCSGPLAPEVKPGLPADPDGFEPYMAVSTTIYYDSLLDPRPELLIDLKDYGTYRELFVQGWE